MARGTGPISQVGLAGAAGLGDQPGEGTLDPHLGEVPLERPVEAPRVEGLHVLRVVAQPPQVLPPSEVAEAEPRLPRHGYHEPAAGDASELLDRRVERLEVLEQLDAGDEIGRPVGHRQHPRICDRAGELRQSLPREAQLVEPVLEADGAMAVAKALERETLAHTDVDDRAVDRTDDASEL